MTLYVPSRRMIDCNHDSVAQRRNGSGKCKSCGQQVFLTVTETRWMTGTEQQEWRKQQKNPALQYEL